MEYMEDMEDMEDMENIPISSIGLYGENTIFLNFFSIEKI